MDDSASNPDAVADRLILVTGASGYIGGRLLRELERAGRRVRCLLRRPERMRPRVAPSTELVQGDVLDPISLSRAMEGVDSAYYLVHALNERGFEEKERSAARHFATAAREAGVRRIIYLGGLGRGAGLSAHLASRQETGEILRDSGVPTAEFRASIVIGSGSLSFEMVRALVEKLPVMVTPRWVRVLAQPIAVEDVMAYLVQALEIDLPQSQVFEIGGADHVSYGGIMQEYARQRGLRRVMIPVPVLTPWLSSLWLALVTPLYAQVGRHLILGVRNETTVHDDRALQAFDVRPRGIREAIERAICNEDEEFAHTRWSDAFSVGGTASHWGGAAFGSRLVDSRVVRLPYPPDEVFGPIRCIGGQVGWYAYDWLWRLRGLIDQALGGVGLRRGRRDPQSLCPGDTLDFWRVEAIEEGRLLRLGAEMKLPGRAWLQYEVEPDGTGSTVRQTALFEPLGLWGRAYWYGIYPLHVLVFAGTLRGVVHAIQVEAQAAERSGRSG